MKKTVYFLILAVVFTSCRKIDSSNSKINAVLVKKCESYMGTPYKFGGTSKKGLDCSGLIYVAFQEVALRFQEFLINKQITLAKFPKMT